MARGEPARRPDHPVSLWAGRAATPEGVAAGMRQCGLPNLCVSDDRGMANQRGGLAEVPVWTSQQSPAKGDSVVVASEGQHECENHFPCEGQHECESYCQLSKMSLAQQSCLYFPSITMPSSRGSGSAVG